MQIISLVFFAFLALVTVVVWLCNKFCRQDDKKILTTKWVLLCASYTFITYADYRFALILAVLTGIVWFCSKSKKLIPVGIVAAILSLAFFKYTNFFADSFAFLFRQDDHVALKILLPLGISFYTFSAIGYLLDVKRGLVESKSLLDVALYLSFFPKITSGPIQKSTDFFAQLDTPRHIGRESLSQGIQIFCWGLFMKLVLADRLSLFVNQVYAAPAAFSSATVLLAVLAYSLQIYFDFSGYSHMAVGVARILDIRLPRNFNLPYLSHNVTEFWKRWHISLSGWLQEYLYISLGGNRKGVLRTYFNLILTMVIGGLWHGPSWTYIIWGLLHGVALTVHKIWTKRTGSPAKPHRLLSNIVCVLVTFAFTSFCWIFFRAESLEKALQILVQLFSFRAGIRQPYFWLFFGLAVLIGCSLVAFLKSKGRILPVNKQNQSYVDGFYPFLNLTKFWHLVLFFVFCGLIIGLAYTGGSPFIYGAY